MSNDSPRLTEDLIWRETDDGIVVVDPKEGKVRVLNGVGSEIWKMVSEKLGRDAIEAQIIESYDISQEQAASDVGAFLEQLTERGMIAWV